MANPLKRGTWRFLAGVGRQDGQYPLQWRFTILGLWASLIGGVLFFSPLAAFTFFVVVWCAGAVWRKDEPPMLVFCLTYQWIFVVTGYYYFLLSGSFPNGLTPGDVSGAVLLSMFGLLAMTFGLRAGMRLVRPRDSAQADPQTPEPPYDIRRLFRVVIIIYTINWFVEIVPRAIFFSAAEIINNVLMFRGILLCALLITIVRRRTGYRYGAIALVYVIVPQFISMMSEFKDLIFLVFVIMLGEWRLWTHDMSERRRNVRMLLGGVVLGAFLFMVGVFWQGGIKPIWRPASLKNEIVGTPIEKIGTFFSVVDQAADTMDWGAGVESLTERFSGVYIFSHVLNYVPQAVPYEDGGLTMRALEHVVKPRIIFPDKPLLGSNSPLVEKYTGMHVAGEEEGTSIGLTYMAEFYIDFKISGMFVALFIWGCLVGLAYGGIFRLSPSHHLASATVMVMLLQPFTSYEGEIAYMLGGLMQTFLILGGILYFFGPSMERKLTARRRNQQLYVPALINKKPAGEF